MAKTFEALKRAEQEKKIAPEEAKVFDLNPHAKPHIPVNFTIPPQIAEEYHRMKHHLVGAHPAKKVKALLFSSSTEGEGTSTVLINFAITLARGGDRIFLVDANLRNPIIHDLFNVEKKGGLTELLLGNYVLQEVVKKTPVRNLSVITSGIPHSSPFSIFESPLLDSLIVQMKTQADLVLFDSPPIHSYNDSSSLAAKMDGVVLVVQAEKTRWEVAQSAKERIKNDRVNILGVVLNRRQMHIPGWAYRML